ncbi:MAG: flagellar protein FlaG [Thiobacillus sp.]
MNVQPASLPAHQAIQPDTRAHGIAPAQSGAPVQPGAPVVSPASPAVPPPPTPEAVQQAVSVINQAMQQANRALQFSVDGETSRTVVKMVDTSTGEVIRQFPSEATLAISRDIEAAQQGLLLKQQA